MGKISFNKDYKNCRVTVVEGEIIETFQVVDIIGDNIEYEHGILEMKDSKKYFDISTGGIHYLFNVDVPAKVEAQNLKRLRRSTALHNIFKYDRNKKFDLVGFMPWVVVILLVLFK